MSKEPQTSVSDQLGERTASGGCSDFHIRHMASIRYPQDLRSAHMSNASMLAANYDRQTPSRASLNTTALLWAIDHSQSLDHVCTTVYLMNFFFILHFIFAFAFLHFALYFCILHLYFAFFIFYLIFFLLLFWVVR